MQVMIVKKTSPGPVTKNILDSLDYAVARQQMYVNEYKNLSYEQTFRDAAITGAAIGLSATTAFRGSTNSLKAAGFAVGATTFFDKVFPLNDRIASAYATAQSYNAMFLSANRLLQQDIDGDYASLNALLPALSGKIAVAQAVAAGLPAVIVPQDLCPPVDATTPPRTTAETQARLQAMASAIACLQKEASTPQQPNADLQALQAQIAVSQQTLALGSRAYVALETAAEVVVETTNAIEKPGVTGVALSFNAAAAAGGVPIAPPPALPLNPAQAHARLARLDAGVDPCTVLQAAEQVQCLQAATRPVQDVLDRADYPSLVKAIADAAPAAPTSPPAQPNTTPARPPGS
jgi:hypothetical protein